jgi:hypothetical protein
MQEQAQLTDSSFLDGQDKAADNSKFADLTGMADDIMTNDNSV